MKIKKRVGVIHGKFQLLHKGHMEYLLEGKRRCDFLYIGITNPDVLLTKEHVTDKNRSNPKSNPFMYYERMEMIRDALLEEGIKKDEFEIVPFPINIPELLKFYIPMDATFFITIYDEWGWHKYNLLKKMDLIIDLMWVREMSERYTSGTEVRNLIANNKEWEYLVPNSVVKYIKEKELDKRIHRIFNDKNK